MESHEILNGKARLYRRPDSDLWYASTYWQGKNHRKATGEKDFEQATAFPSTYCSVPSIFGLLRELNKSICSPRALRGR